MAEKQQKLSLKDQRQSIAAAINGKVAPQNYDMNAGASLADKVAQTQQAPLNSYALSESPQAAQAREDAAQVAGMQDQNAQNPAVADRLQATNEAVRRYNEKMQAEAKAKLMGAMAQQAPAPDSAVGQQYGAMQALPGDEANQQALLKQALLRKLAGNQ